PLELAAQRRGRLDSGPGQVVSEAQERALDEEDAGAGRLVDRLRTYVGDLQGVLDLERPGGRGDDLDQAPGPGAETPGARHHGLPHRVRHLVAGGDHLRDEEGVTVGGPVDPRGA